ncbi:MAG: hypothetical protein NZ840_13640, partial [Anaerolineales bacterium]|nr:hypothetical protein [Anaerolineales bacterium]MDW8163078.1 hypothetical protein [Anaerolineales bacterium]
MRRLLGVYLLVVERLSPKALRVCCSERNLVIPAHKCVSCPALDWTALGGDSLGIVFRGQGFNERNGRQNLPIYLEQPYP